MTYGSAFLLLIVSIAFVNVVRKILIEYIEEREKQEFLGHFKNGKRSKDSLFSKSSNGFKMILSKIKKVKKTKNELTE